MNVQCIAGGDAIALIEIDGELGEDLIKKIANLESVTQAIPMRF